MSSRLVFSRTLVGCLLPVLVCVVGTRAASQQRFDNSVVKQATTFQSQLETWRKSLDYVPIEGLQLNYRQEKLLESAKARALKEIVILEKLTQSIKREETLQDDVMLLRSAEFLREDLMRLAALFGSAYISSGYKNDVDLVMTAKCSDQLVSTAEEVDRAADSVLDAVLLRLAEVNDEIVHCEGARSGPDRKPAE
jgi:hypothetical protein